MAERLTILWKTPRPVLSRAEKEEGHRTVTDLQIDRAFRLICPDTMIREAFLSALLTPLTDPDDILERQKIIAFFHESPQLLDRLTELVRRIAMTKNAWDSERSRLLASRTVNPQDKSMLLWTARGTLILTAHFFRIFISCIRDIHESLQMFGCPEGWLGRLRERTYAIGCTQDMEEILRFTDRLEKNLANAHSYDIEFDCDAQLSMTPVFLRDFQFIRTPEKVQKKTKNPLLLLLEKTDRKAAEKADENGNSRKEEAQPEREVPLGSMDVDWGMEMSAKAVQECDRYLTSFLRTVIDVFADLEDELYFYKAALMHIDRLAERHVQLINPQILPMEENTLAIRELSDLLLLTESMNVLSVVPNDAEIGQNGSGVSGILVTGKNNSGKTVYLRSVGTAVLLAQCGLPIPAKEAAISIRSRIFTTFARAEGELEPLSSAGRFEEEAAEIAGIISRIVPHALVLMNETFQTTSYDEGSEGMAGILEYLTALGCGFIFVTHLTKLLDMLRCNGTAEILKTSDDPRTRYKISRESVGKA
ncbi:MAG: hypothetical protein IJC71_06540 [Clostridia bacterium]|nr:hypothetical protein [Clostridia bacterium]